MTDLRNPHNYKLCDTKLEKIPNSELLKIALAFNSGQYYTAAVDPITKKNYVIHANINSQGPKFGVSYSDIVDDTEHRAASDFFLKAGVFEMFYKGGWYWETHDSIQNIPPWFKGKYLK
jgi:hypothetical protein